MKAVSGMASAGARRKGKSELLIEYKFPVMQDEKVLDMYHTPLFSQFTTHLAICSEGMYHA